MISPLLSVGGTALGTMAWQALRQLQPGEFVRELLAGHDPPAAVADTPAAVASTNNILDAAGTLKSLVTMLRERFTAAGVDLTQDELVRLAPADVEFAPEVTGDSTGCSCSDRRHRSTSAG